MKSAVRISLQIFIFIVPVYVLAIAVRPLFAPDEIRYAEIPREMLATGNWVVPHFVGLKYFEKPAFGYWLVATSISLFGENDFAVRIPALLSTVFTALCLALLVFKSRRDSELAWYSAGAYLISPLVFGIGPLNILDNPFTFLLTACISSFFLATQGEGRSRWSWVVASGVFCGLAVLTKGFLGVVLPIAVIGPFLLWTGRLFRFLPACFLCIALAVLVVLPWGLAIHAGDSDFWRYFFWEEHIRRFSAGNAQHPEKPWFFIPILLGGVIAWLPLMLPMFSRVKERSREDLFKFCLCWFVLPFLFFSASRGKLPTYIMPCMPPLAVLFVTALIDYFRQKGTQGLQLPLRLFAVIMLAVASGFLIFEIATGGNKAFAFPAEASSVMLIASALIIFSGALIQSSTKENYRELLSVFAVGPIAVFVVAAVTVPNRFLVKRAPENDMRMISHLIDRETSLIVQYGLASSVGWYLHRTDFFIPFDGNEFTYGLERPEARQRFLREVSDVRGVIDAGQLEGRKTALLLSPAGWAAVKSSLPAPRREYIFGGSVVVSY